MNSTKWLASVQSLDEARSLSDCLPDILDMKQPSQGALGALPLSVVSEIVNWVQQRCLTSATVGDLPMKSDVIAPALQAMSHTGVDYVKLGLFGGAQQQECLKQLTPVIENLVTPVIAVIFADIPNNKDVVRDIKAAGFQGVMVDTAYKTGTSLLDLWSTTALATFINEARQEQLICGLAGALRVEDIPALSAFHPDYLGFRSALCPQRERKRSLCPESAIVIKGKLNQALEKAS